MKVAACATATLRSASASVRMFGVDQQLVFAAQVRVQQVRPVGVDRVADAGVLERAQRRAQLRQLRAPRACAGSSSGQISSTVPDSTSFAHRLLAVRRGDAVTDARRRQLLQHRQHARRRRVRRLARVHRRAQRRRARAREQVAVARDLVRPAPACATRGPRDRCRRRRGSCTSPPSSRGSRSAPARTRAPGRRSGPRLTPYSRHARSIPRRAAWMMWSRSRSPPRFRFIGLKRSSISDTPLDRNSLPMTS